MKKEQRSTAKKAKKPVVLFEGNKTIVDCDKEDYVGKMYTSTGAG